MTRYSLMFSCLSGLLRLINRSWHDLQTFNSWELKNGAEWDESGEYRGGDRRMFPPPWFSSSVSKREVLQEEGRNGMGMTYIVRMYPLIVRGEILSKPMIYGLTFMNHVQI